MFSTILAAYWFERGRNPGWGDSLGFLIGALKGFSWSVNATGHFFYSILNAFILRVFPSADPLFLLTAASIGFSIVALWQIYRTAMMLTGCAAASLAATLMLAFSFTFWRQAVSIEVYPLHSALLAAFLRMATRDILTESRNHAEWIGIAFGLALLTHIQTVLLLPAYVFWFFFRKGAVISDSLQSAVWIIAAFLLLVIPAAIIPELTIASVFVDFRFAEQVFAIDAPVLFKGFLKSIAYLAYNFHFFLPLIALGAVHAYRMRRRVFILYACVFIPVWGFAFRYPISDNYIFFLPAYLVLALTGAVGFAVLMDRFKNRKWLSAAFLAAAVILSPGIYRAAVFFAESIPLAGNAFTSVRYKGGAAYYLWPGLRKIPDPLVIVRGQYPGGSRPPQVDIAAWENLYPKAIAYLRLRGQLSF